MRTHDQTIQELRIADSIAVLELYCVVDDQRRPKIDSRIWDGFRLMGAEDAKRFVDEFNAATAAVRNKWMRRYRDAAAETLLGGRDLTD